MLEHTEVSENQKPNLDNLVEDLSGMASLRQKMAELQPVADQLRGIAEQLQTGLTADVVIDRPLVDKFPRLLEKLGARRINIQNVDWQASHDQFGNGESGRQVELFELNGQQFWVETEVQRGDDVSARVTKTLPEGALDAEALKARGLANAKDNEQKEVKQIVENAVKQESTPAKLKRRVRIIHGRIWSAMTRQPVTDFYKQDLEEASQDPPLTEIANSEIGQRIHDKVFQGWQAFPKVMQVLRATPMYRPDNSIGSVILDVQYTKVDFGSNQRHKETFIVEPNKDFLGKLIQTDEFQELLDSANRASGKKR